MRNKSVHVKVKPFSPLFFQRTSHLLYVCHIPVIPRLITYMLRLVFSCYLPAKLYLSKNTRLSYQALGIVIHDNAQIGENVEIGTHVTIGGNAREKGVPRIGDNVYIGSGAKVLGPIEIGDNVVIGANSVVTKDIPPNHLVAGNPLRIMKTNIDPSRYLYHRRNRTV